MNKILRRDFNFKEAVGGRWIVLCKGVQWAPTGFPRDKSGCGKVTYKTKQAAQLSVAASLDWRKNAKA